MGQMVFPVIGTVLLTSVWLTGTEYTKFVNGTPFVPLTRSPVNGGPVNEFRREVPVNGTVPLTGTECTTFYLEVLFK